MQAPKLIRKLLWLLFLNDRSNQGKPVIYNLIKYDVEENIDIFLTFIGGERGYLWLSAVDHSDTSEAELVFALGNKIKFFYNLAGTDYEIVTLVHGKDILTDEFDALKKRALSKPTWGDRFREMIRGLCYG